MYSYFYIYVLEKLFSEYTSRTCAKHGFLLVTDYITKTQLKTHVAYAALELAIQKLGKYDPNEDELTYRAKCMLQRYTYSMLSHQELSAPQVVSYLMDYEDHFTSHRFTCFYWSNIESYVNANAPLSTSQSNELHNETSTSGSDAAPVNRDNDQLEVYIPSDIIGRSDALGNTDADCSESESDVTDLLDCQEGNSDPAEEPLDVPTQSEEHVTDNTLEAEDEVTFYVNESGGLATKCTYLEDYLYCSPELHDVCFWDYISRVEKVSISKDKRKHRKNASTSVNMTSDDDTDDSENDDPDSQFVDESVLDKLCDLHWHNNHYLANTKRKRPRIPFDQEHGESCTHHQVIHSHSRRLVAVPLGLSIPRRDCPEIKERHAHLMLILLKPWISVTQLKPTGMTWADAYESFLTQCSVRTKRIIENMQILHECHDSRDDHFEKRNRQRRAEARQAPGDFGRRNENPENTVLDEEDILAHLESMDSETSQRQNRSNEMIFDCLHHAEDVNLIQSSPQEFTVTEPSTEAISCEHCLIEDNNMERSWEAEYENRRQAWKTTEMSSQSSDKLLQLLSTTEVAQATISSAMTLYSNNDPINSLPTEDVEMDAFTGVSSLPHADNTNMECVQTAVDPDEVSATWKLNERQHVAYRMIVSRIMWSILSA